MTLAKILTPLLLLNALPSCSNSPSAQKLAEQERKFQEETSQRRTYKQGTLAARKHVQETGFKICRYDFPIVTVGVWPHRSHFRRFGVKGGCDIRGTLSYHKGYNAEMDRLLLKRYGSGYQKYRKEMIPPPDAEPSSWFKHLAQPEQITAETTKR